MKQKWMKLMSLALAGVLVLGLSACGETQSSQSAAQTNAAAAQAEANTADTQSQSGGETASQVTQAATGSGAIDSAELFTERDLTQTAELSEAVSYTLEDGQTLTLTEAGVYVLSGTAVNASVVVEAGDEDKVQLVLEGLHLSNDNSPCVYVKGADKVFLTTAQGSENSLSVSGSFSADGDMNTDAVIFSKADLVLNGLGTLRIESSDNGVSCKDDLKITGGSLEILCGARALEANDSIAIADGSIEIQAGSDGLHSDNDEDDTQGWIWIGGGSLEIQAEDDAVHALSILQIDDGRLNISAAEGLEATWVQINGGEISISASDDGINGAAKSSAYTPTIEINGGSLTIVMGAGDTDGIDSNGNLVITGGTVDVTAQNPFDYDGSASCTGGTLIVNGSQVDSIPNQFGGMGGMGGGPGSGSMPGGGRR